VQQTQLQDLLRSLMKGALLQRMIAQRGQQGPQPAPGQQPGSPMPGIGAAPPMPSTPMPGA
jgi:hypothetical protein